MRPALAELIDIAPEVKDALPSGRVVALESSVIAQGLPPPHNLETAQKCMDAVRAGGSVPATIAILGGRILVGATMEQLAQLADPARKPAKAGVRDLGALLAEGRDAGTTVSATSLIAHQCGIRVFATGGIGGVHRRMSPDEPLDISSDLEEMARRPVCIVSAGPKAILDVPATAELLETMAIPVFGYGTSELPAFYTDSSNLKLEHRFDDPASVRRALKMHWDVLGLPSAVLLCVPPPSPLTKREIEAALMVALRDSKAHGMSGKEATPYLLKAVARATGGRSIEANIALLVNNARVAGLVAAA
ncbi:MAG: pseudouridine-5'-phosphate glycosidase [Deltaproteobacteria bacterium]|nr:pseudouridine-5'-phosphate glycosidase [Deltaproteobacteria bacterium]